MYEILSTVHQGNSRFGTIFLIIITDLKKTRYRPYKFLLKNSFLFTVIGRYLILRNCFRLNAVGRKRSYKIYCYNVAKKETVFISHFFVKIYIC